MKLWQVLVSDLVIIARNDKSSHTGISITQQRLVKGAAMARNLRHLAEMSEAADSTTHKQRREVVLDYILDQPVRERSLENGKHLEGDDWSVRVYDDSAVGSHTGILRFDGATGTLTHKAQDDFRDADGNRELRLEAWSPCRTVRVTKDPKNPIVEVFESQYGNYRVGGIGWRGTDSHWTEMSVRVYDGEIFVLGCGYDGLSGSFWSMARFPRHFCPPDKGIHSNGAVRWWFIETAHTRDQVERSVFVGTAGQPIVVFRHSLDTMRAYNCITNKETTHTFSNLFDFDADDRGVIVCANGQLILWDVRGKQVIRVVNLDAILPQERRFAFATSVRINPANRMIVVFFWDGGAVYLNSAYTAVSSFVPCDQRDAEAILAASRRAGRNNTLYKLSGRHRLVLSVAAGLGSAWASLVLRYFAPTRQMKLAAVTHSVDGHDTAVTRMLLDAVKGTFNFKFWKPDLCTAMLEVILPRCNGHFKRSAIGSCLRNLPGRDDAELRGMLDTLLLHGCRPPRNIFSTLFDVIGAYTGLVERILCTIITEHGATIDLDARNCQGRVALQQLQNIGSDAANTQMYRNLLRLLLEAGADANAGAGFGVPPLLTAIRREDLAATKLLLDNGANPFQLSVDARSTAASAMLLRESIQSRPPYKFYRGTLTQMLSGARYLVTEHSLVRLLHSALRMNIDASAIRLILGARASGSGIEEDAVLQYLISHPQRVGQDIGEIAYHAFCSRNRRYFPTGERFIEVLQPMIDEIVRFYVEDKDEAGAHKGWIRITHPRLGDLYVNHLGALIQKYSNFDPPQKNAGRVESLTKLASYFDIKVSFDAGVRLERKEPDWHTRVLSGARMLVAWAPLTRTHFSSFELAVRQVVWAILLCRERLSRQQLGLVWGLDVCHHMLFNFVSTDPREFRRCWNSGSVGVC